jgi:hypothetical protein
MVIQSLSVLSSVTHQSLLNGYTKKSHKIFFILSKGVGMPRGKSRKNPVVEVLPPEEANQPMREVKHTTQWVELRPAEESATDDDAQEDFEFIEEEKTGRRRKTAKDEREAFRRELDKLGVASVSRLKLSIDKYRHSDAEDSGTLAEKDFCTKDPVTKEHILNEDYLATARKFGPGRYWFTLRMDNKILRQWEQRINPVVTPTGPVIQQVNPSDPNSPQVIYQTNGDGQAQIPMSIKDIMKTQREALKEQLEMAKLMREAYGFAPEQPQQPKSEEEILASAILKQPDVIENVVGSVIKRFGGSGGKEDEPWYADVVRDAVKSGQAAQIVQVAIDRIFNGFQGLIPGRQNNGQAQMGAETVSPVAHPQNNNPQESRPTLLAHAEGQGDAQIQQGMGNDQNAQTQRATSPEEQALARMIENCARRVPPQIAFDQLMAYADALNDQAPQYSIDGYIAMFAAMPVDQALEFVKSQPNGEQEIALDHAKAWTEELQKLIKSQEGEE